LSDFFVLMVAFQEVNQKRKLLS